MVMVKIIHGAIKDRELTKEEQELESQLMREEDIYRRVALRIKMERKEHGLTLTQLAGKTGLNLSFIGNIERCNSKPTLYTLEKIAKALGLEVSELFMVTHSNPTPKRTLQKYSVEARLKEKIGHLLSGKPEKELKKIHKILKLIV